MSAVPIKQYDPGFVNCVTHSLTGAQILFYAFHSWATDQNQSITLWCRKGDAQQKANALRVALAKERKQRQIPRTFELRFGEVFPYTHDGVKGEAIKVERVGGTLQTRMRAAFFEIQKGKLP